MKISSDPEEKTKYKKRKVKVTPKKSDHKHNYEKRVLFHYNVRGFDFYFSGLTCTICGKVGSTTRFETENGRWLTNEEILAKYKGLEIWEYKW